MISAKHKEQVKALIGKKITVYLSLKKFTKVLREDKDGIYVLHQKERVPVHPDTNGLNVLYFTGLDPKNMKAIEKMHEGDNHD